MLLSQEFLKILNLEGFFPSTVFLIGSLRHIRDYLTYRILFTYLFIYLIDNLLNYIAYTIRLYNVCFSILSCNIPFIARSFEMLWLDLR